MLKKIFSIKNKDFYKVITILGQEFKFKSNRLIIKSLKQDLKNLENYITVQDNYAQVVTRLKKKLKSEPLKVIFYSSELQKWTYDSLYRELEKSEFFNPIVVIIPLIRMTDEVKEQMLSEQYEFYKKLNCKVKFGYINKEYIDLKTFNPDIVFYQQPWDIPEINTPENVSQYALTCYCSYGSQVLDYKKEYMPNFHKLLWTYICENDLNIKRFESYKTNNSKNCVALGYPKLDVYINNSNPDSSKYWKNSKKTKIIYAPHHSLDKADISLATFMQNGEFILDLAKKYSDETTWIFKPHPRLKYILEQGKYMKKDKIKKYWQEWDSIGKVCEDGDYWDILRTSDLMITDCASFLIEYLPTGKPLLRLINPNAVLNKFALHFISQYYNSYNNNDLENLFIDLVINKNDYKKAEREKLIAELIDFNQPSAVKILNYLIDKIKD